MKEMCKNKYLSTYLNSRKDNIGKKENEIKMINHR
jgi:hypothetical protein